MCYDIRDRGFVDALWQTVMDPTLKKVCDNRNVEKAQDDAARSGRLFDLKLRRVLGAEAITRQGGNTLDRNYSPWDD